MKDLSLELRDLDLGTCSPLLCDFGPALSTLWVSVSPYAPYVSPHSSDLASCLPFQHSYREVGILLLYLAVGVSVFSGVAYTAEKEEDVGFDTIPACWWWGTVSMTTVGYGDVVPVTVAGKLAASGCILGGILVVALPITIIFNKFSHFYRRQKALEAAVRNSDPRGFEDLLSSVAGVSEASLDTSHETSEGGRSADLEVQPPSGPPDPQVY